MAGGGAKLRRQAEEALRMVEQPCGSIPLSTLVLTRIGLGQRIDRTVCRGNCRAEDSPPPQPDFLVAHFHLAVSYLSQWLAQQSPATPDVGTGSGGDTTGPGPQ